MKRIDARYGMIVLVLALGLSGCAVLQGLVDPASQDELDRAALIGGDIGASVCVVVALERSDLSPVLAVVFAEMQRVLDAGGTVDSLRHALRHIPPSDDTIRIALEVAVDRILARLPQAEPTIAPDSVLSVGLSSFVASCQTKLTLSV